jgi:hypothetical protein
VLNVHNTTVDRVVKRFEEHGEAALWDGREDNGREKSVTQTNSLD